MVDSRHDAMLPIIGTAQSEPLTGLDGTGGFGWMLLETALLLAAVCLLAYVVIRVLVRRLYGGTGASPGGRGRLEVLDRLVLEPRRSLQVVRAGSKTLLVGVSEGQISLIDELDPADWEESMSRPVRGAFKRTLRDVLNRSDREQRRPEGDGSPSGERAEPALGETPR